MSNHHHEADSKNFMLPVFLSFAIVFCLFILMARCSGPYVVPTEHGNAHGTEHKTEHAPAHGAEHKTGDTTLHHSDSSTHHEADTAAHKTEAVPAEHH